MALRSKWPHLAFGVVLLVGVAACDPDRDRCPEGSVPNPHASTCTIADQLVVVSVDQDAVESAMAAHGGEVLEATGTTYTIRFPVDDLDELERIRQALSAAGLDVRYAVVISPF